MKFAKLLALLFTFVACLEVSAQRYLKPAFTQVSATTVAYGSNFTVLTLSSPLMHTARQQLAARVYTPAGDTRNDRPLIIFLHTGNFLPFNPTTVLNGSCGGTIFDSSAVEICTRLAKMGYVVASADYRTGWNPLAPLELSRRFTLINAAYRGVQDVRTCIRYFRKSVDVGGNPFGIDPNKIIVFGQGTGGYISMAAAYLNTYGEILTTSDPSKYLLPINATTKIPMVQEKYNGDVFGTPAAPCIADATYNAITGGGIPIGDTLCVSNHPGYSSAFNLAVNLGGALGDSTWMDAGEPPLISFHNPNESFAPCKTDVLNVGTPTGPQPVVEVSGSCDMQAQAERMGLNKVFNQAAINAANLQLYDQFGSIARTRNGNQAGFYPFVGTKDNTGSPWEWAAPGPATTPINCNFNKPLATAYIDTIINYFAPRAALALKLDVVGTQDINSNIEMQIAPNPAIDQTVITVPANYLMKGLDVVDASGRIVRNIKGINSNTYSLERAGMPRGMYFIKAYFEEGIVTRRIVFE
jgi:hypothetical protein